MDWDRSGGGYYRVDRAVRVQDGGCGIEKIADEVGASLNYSALWGMDMADSYAKETRYDKYDRPKLDC